MKSSIRQFNPQGRAKFAEYIFKAHESDTKLDKDEILDLITSDTFTKPFISAEIDSDKLFDNRYSMADYLWKILFTKNEELWHKEIFSNWGLLEWLAAFYFEQIMRPDNKRAGSKFVTPSSFLILRHGKKRAEDEELLGTFRSTITSRHSICFYLYYYSIYRSLLENLLGDKLYTSSEITEQLFAGMEDRLSRNLLKFINEMFEDNWDTTWEKTVKAIGIKTDKRPMGARNIHKYQLCIRNSYHPEKMEYNEFKEKMLELADIYTP